MTGEWRYLVTWPTFPNPTPAMDERGEVMTFATRKEAIRYGEDHGMPYPADNVTRRKVKG